MNDKVQGHYGSRLYESPSRIGHAGGGLLRSNLSVNGDTNTVRTPGGYLLQASKGDNAQLKLYDPKTDTWTFLHGDPHGISSDGNRFDFSKGPVTFILPDDTKVTVNPTKLGNGNKEFISNVVITNGNQGAVIKYSPSGEPTTEARSNWRNRLDDKHRDGVKLFAQNGQLDDFTVGRFGPEANGDLDRYANGRPDCRTGPCFGDGDRPRLPTRPGDGPGWPHHGPHHGPHPGGPHGPHRGRHENRQISHLLDQLRSYQSLAHHGPWGARLHARYEMHRIQERLRELAC
jgi:uncharacterized protein DUF1521